jgi:hypothetical protein
LECLPYQEGFATIGCHHRNPPARRQYPHHLVEHADRFRHEVQGGEAAHDVECAVIEGQAESVSAHVDRTVAAIVADGALHHRHRIVQPDDESIPNELVGEEAGEVARTARDIEHPLPPAQMQCRSGSFTLRRDGHPVQAHRSDHDGPPDVLIDRGDHRTVHRALREAAAPRATGSE